MRKLRKSLAKHHAQGHILLKFINFQTFSVSSQETEKNC